MNESEQACVFRRASDRQRKAEKLKNETIKEAEARRAYYRQCRAKTVSQECKGS